MSLFGLSPSAKRRALRLRLKRIREKIASVEAEIAAVETGQPPQPGLFPQEHPGLRSLRERLARLRELAASMQTELRYPC